MRAAARPPNRALASRPLSPRSRSAGPHALVRLCGLAAVARAVTPSGASLSTRAARVATFHSHSRDAPRAGDMEISAGSGSTYIAPAAFGPGARTRARGARSARDSPDPPRLGVALPVLTARVACAASAAGRVPRVEAGAPTTGRLRGRMRSQGAREGEAFFLVARSPRDHRRRAARRAAAAAQVVKNPPTAPFALATWSCSAQ